MSVAQVAIARSEDRWHLARFRGEAAAEAVDEPGVEARLRIGRFDGTRLVIGASAIEGLGSRAFTEMHIETFERVPLAAAVTVTNLPVDGDLGLQLDLRAGYRVFDWLAVNALAGWNARTINHYGFTGGGGLTLNW
ncbi:MAG: hypothetical protein KC620_13455 [Myxococcales bacterium]|nr:hypothetical protein [Myxococcales bacterium]